MKDWDCRLSAFNNLLSNLIKKMAMFAGTCPSPKRLMNNKLTVLKAIHLIKVSVQRASILSKHPHTIFPFPNSVTKM